MVRALRFGLGGGIFQAGQYLISRLGLLPSEVIAPDHGPDGAPVRNLHELSHIGTVVNPDLMGCWRPGQEDLGSVGPTPPPQLDGAMRTVDLLHHPVNLMTAMRLAPLLGPQARILIRELGETGQELFASRPRVPVG